MGFRGWLSLLYLSFRRKVFHFHVLCISRLEILYIFSISLKPLEPESNGIMTRPGPEAQRDNQSDFEVEYPVMSSSDWISEEGLSEDTPLCPREEDKRPGVPDGCKKVWIVFYLLGMTTLLPWNFFIAVNNYWDFKFRDVTNTTLSTGDNQTKLQKEFTSYLAIASNIPNAIFVILNVIYGQKFRLNVRIMGSLTIMATLFIAVLIMTRIDSDLWQEWFLASTLLIVVFLNICTAVFQGGLIGVAGKFPSKYMGGMMAGQALGGIFPALVNIGVIALKVSSLSPISAVCTRSVSGQPGEPRLLLLPGGIYICDIEPGGLHGGTDHHLLQASRRHRGPGHHHHHLHHLLLLLQGECGHGLEILAERLLDIPLVPDRVPECDGAGAESVQVLGGRLGQHLLHPGHVLPLLQHRGLPRPDPGLAHQTPREGQDGPEPHTPPQLSQTL